MKTETKEVKLFILAKKSNHSSEFVIEVDTLEFATDKYTTYITLDTQVVNVEIPELDEKVLVLAQVEQLQDAIKAEKAEHYLRVTSLEEKISSLMCLENKTDDDDDDDFLPF